jgi:hypothetical protein
VPTRPPARHHAPGHPPTVYVNQQALLHAVTDTLATALYGPDRAAYWEHALTAPAQPDLASPARSRIAELQQAAAGVQARLRRQVLNLEDDELSHHARRHIAGRIAELEDELAGYQASLARIPQQPDPAPPDALTVRELLATFPVKAWSSASWVTQPCGSCSPA